MMLNQYPLQMLIFGFTNIQAAHISKRDRIIRENSLSCCLMAIITCWPERLDSLLIAKVFGFNLENQLQFHHD